MDWLKEAAFAKNEGDNAEEWQSYYAAAQVAALIAIAEAQRPRFVQVGDYRICVDRIVSVENFGDGINIWLDRAPCIQLYGAQKALFLIWFDQHAEIERLSTEAEQ